jgi:hypothetical protein
VVVVALLVVVLVEAVVVVAVVVVAVVVVAVVVVAVYCAVGACAELESRAGLAAGAAARALWVPSVPSGTEIAVAAISASVGAERRLSSIWLQRTCAGA